MIEPFKLAEAWAALGTFNKKPCPMSLKFWYRFLLFNLGNNQTRSCHTAMFYLVLATELVQCCNDCKKKDTKQDHLYVC